MKKQQDELSQRRRLNKGQCPKHGASLVQLAIWTEGGDSGPVVVCPRRNCAFRRKVKRGTKVYEALVGEEDGS